MRPDDRRYLESHEWCKVEGDVATIGITDFAVSQLGDLTFLDLNVEPGAEVSIGDEFGVIESVKTVSELYSPVAGEVVEINEGLTDELDTLGEDPWAKGWMIKIKVQSESQDLIDASAYESQVQAQS